jgi:hypothetical protein
LTPVTVLADWGDQDSLPAMQEAVASGNAVIAKGGFRGAVERFALAHPSLRRPRHGDVPPDQMTEQADQWPVPVEVDPLRVG